MKKTATLLLMLAMMLGMGALAQEEGAIVQSSCNIVQSGEYVLVYCFAQVHNNSDQTICLDEGSLYLMNGEEMLARSRISRLWPSFLAPGADGYLFDIVTLETGGEGAGMPSVTGLQFDLSYMTVDPAYGGQPLETQGRIEIDDRTGRMSIVCEISNTTDEDAFGAMVEAGLYTEGGQMLYACGTQLKDVGIPKGGTMLLRFGVEEELVEQWSGYGMTPAYALTSAVFSDNED